MLNGLMRASLAPPRGILLATLLAAAGLGYDRANCQRPGRLQPFWV
jgi:hypothetical protein